VYPAFCVKDQSAPSHRPNRFIWALLRDPSTDQLWMFLGGSAKRSAPRQIGPPVSMLPSRRAKSRSAIALLSRFQTDLSIPILLRLVRPADRHADVARLLVVELGEPGADLVEVQARDLLIQVLGQGVDLLLVFGPIGEELDLRQRLVAEGRGHDEAR